MKDKIDKKNMKNEIIEIGRERKGNSREKVGR